MRTVKEKIAEKGGTDKLQRCAYGETKVTKLTDTHHGKALEDPGVRQRQIWSTTEANHEPLLTQKTKGNNAVKINCTG